jgi:hypothetical protein
MAGVLARTETVPLHLEAYFTRLSTARLDAFERQLEAHISHTRHLSLGGQFLQSVLDRLAVSSAPTLEFLSLSYKLPRWLSQPLPQVAIIPANLFNRTHPSLTSLELKSCNISWKSPLLKRLRTLEILRPSSDSRPELDDWLDVLNEMSQLETLVLQSASPPARQDAPLVSEQPRAATLPFLTRFHISDSAKECALALAHLVLPVLTWLHVDAGYLEMEGEDLQVVFPYVARNLSGLLGTEPLRSILISSERRRSEVVGWTVPAADVNVCDPNTLLSASFSARFMFAATGARSWPRRMDSSIFDSILKLLPMNSVSTLSVQNDTRLSKEFWLRHAPRLPLLEQARLIHTAIRAFRDMLAEDAPLAGPRLPLLEKILLVDVPLSAPRAYHLRDMLMERVEQEVPLEVLDLRRCVAGDRSVQSLAEIVVEVQEPLAGQAVMLEEPAFFDWGEGIGYWYDIEYYDERRPWHFPYRDEFEQNEAFNE